jgi:hypothetical protein
MSRQRQKNIMSILGGRQISPTGVNWLTQALDPFHDTDIPPTGFPDFSTDSSIVACIEKTVSISCPASISTGTWDAHIFSLPLMAGTVTTTGNAPAWSVRNEGTLTAGVGAAFSVTPGVMQGLNNTMDLSNINYIIQPSGSNTLPTVATAAFTPSAAGWVDCGQTWSNGNSRLVALGFEVANTTAEISKQGAVAYYRCPQAYQDGSIYLSPTSSLGAIVPARAIRYPPANLAEAMLLRGTIVREAAEGAYVPVTFSSSVNDFKTRKTVVLGLRYSDQEGYPLLTNAPTFTSTTGLLSNDVSIEEAPFDTCGAYFTGLSLTTTLQLTVRFYVEKVPAPFDSSLVVLSRPAPPYDPIALELYKRVVAQLPPGTRLADNADGDWWNSLLKVVSWAAPMVGTLFAPLTGGASIAIGAGVSAAAKAAADYDSSRGKSEVVHKTPSNGPVTPTRPPVGKIKGQDLPTRPINAKYAAKPSWAPK